MVVKACLGGLGCLKQQRAVQGRDHHIHQASLSRDTSIDVPPSRHQQHLHETLVRLLPEIRVNSLCPVLSSQKTRHLSTLKSVNRGAHIRIRWQPRLLVTSSKWMSSLPGGNIIRATAVSRPYGQSHQRLLRRERVSTRWRVMGHISASVQVPA